MHGDAGGMMATEPHKEVVHGVKCPTPTPRLPGRSRFIYYDGRKGNFKFGRSTQASRRTRGWVYEETAAGHAANINEHGHRTA